ncbi:MAG: hypothetical protein ABSC48_16385 [Terracidiphilus sp.]
MDSFGAELLSIALIGPDEYRRKAVASALAERRGSETREFFYYPASLDDVPKLLETHFDIIIIDLDSQPEYALELVESFCASTAATVMVYSGKTDAELLVRCMRAGAREFLILPLAENIMPEALARAAARRSATRPATAKKAVGRLLVFLGAKGGDGVTTLACNFAVSLAQESSQSTLLIDLDLPLGDAALAIDKLIAVARQDFENVIIDIGSRLDLMGTSLFKEGATVYLVIQAGIAGLRNSNRLISQYFATDVPKLEIVLNRFQSRSSGVPEDHVTKALTRPANWKIPNDYSAVRRMQHTAVPLALEDSPISRQIRQMARTACGLPATPGKGSGFSLKKISRSISAKIASSEEAPAPTQPVVAPEQDSAVPAPVAAQPEDEAATPAETADAASTAAAVADGQQEPVAPAEAAESVSAAEATGETQQDQTIPGQPVEPETRTYKGATYVRGEDGQWHLRRTQTGEAVPETPVIAWSTPAPIAYGSALGATQLNAMASVPGKFAYNPSTGDLLPAGEHTLSVTFSPADTAGYTEAEATVQITVTKATPVITWPAPAAIFCGTALGATELNAAASVPGTFVYTPAAGEALPAGVHTLSVAFTPADAEGYAEAQSAVSLTVSQATPTITWPAPDSIPYGTALSADQLNATGSVLGVFVYTPAVGAVLTTGTHTLSATFTPADGEGYTEAQAGVPLTVTQATPIITWPAPADISADTALSADQLNATASVPGTFVYTPAAGEVLPEGTHTLSAIFTPADAADYAVVQATAQLTVTKAAPEAIGPAPAAISQDVPVSAAPLSIESELAPVEPGPAEAEEPAAEAVPLPRKAKAKASPKPQLKTAQEVPAEVSAGPSVEEAQLMAPAEPPVETPVKTPARARAKAPAKVREKLPAKALIERSVKLSAGPPVEAPGTALVKAQAPKAPFDVGPGLDLMGSAVFEDGTTIYLVMQPGSAGLPNSNRLVSQFFASGGPKPDFVLNRFEPPSASVAEGQISTALTQPAYTPASRQAGQMVRQTSDLAATPGKKTGFSLKGLGRSIWAKISTTEKPPSITRLGLAAEEEKAGTAPRSILSDLTAGLSEKPIYAPPANTSSGAGAQVPLPTSPTVDRTDLADANRPREQSAGAPKKHDEPATRIYKGSTYVRGADGQWHLKKAEASDVKKETPAIALATHTPVVPSTVRSTDEPGAKPKPAPAKVEPAEAKEPAPKEEPEPRKIPADAPAKPLVEAAQKPLPKAPAKRQLKTVPKPSAKTPGKRPVKAAQKPAAKAVAKRPVKAAQKPPARTASKRPVKVAQKPSAKAAAKGLKKTAQKPSAKAAAKGLKKTAQKPLAKAAAHKYAPASKKLVTAPNRMTVKAVKRSQPAVKKPAPEPTGIKRSTAPAVNGRAAGPAKKV